MKKIYSLIVISLIAGIMSGGCRSKKEPDAQVEYGLALLKNCEYESARNILGEAALVFTNNITVHYNLGLACWKLGDNDAAITALTKAVDIGSDGDARPLELLAFVLIDSGNALGAGKVLSNIEKPTASSLTIMALASERAGSSELARSYLGQALDLDPKYPPALYNLALLHRDVFSNSDEALFYYNRFKAVAPDDIRADNSPLAFIGQGVESGEGTVNSGQWTVESGEGRVESVEQIVEAVVLHPADELLEKARLALERDEADIALITLKSTVRKYPDSANAVWALAELYDKNLGNKVKANELYKKFVVMFPTDIRSATAKKNVIAVSVANRPVPTVDTKVENGESYFRTGLEHYNKQEWDSAIVAYTKGLKIEKSSRIAYNLGLAYKGKGDLSKAETAFKLSLRLQPDKPNALYMLGLTEMEQGNNELALTQLNRLIRIKPDFAAAHHLLGLIYCEANHPDMTIIHFKRFVHLAPTDRNADQVRAWLAQNQGRQE